MTDLAATAPEPAVAVNAVWSVLFAVCTWNAVGVSSTPSDDWKVDSALFRVPSAEICVLTACVCVEISDCCGAAVAATSCDTSELTLMTEPPAASALELLAIDTTGCPVLPLVLLVVVIAAYPLKPL